MQELIAIYRHSNCKQSLNKAVGKRRLPVFMDLDQMQTAFASNLAKEQSGLSIPKGNFVAEDFAIMTPNERG